MNTTQIKGEHLYQLEQSLTVRLYRDEYTHEGTITLVLCEGGSWQDSADRFCAEPRVLTVAHARSVIRGSLFPAEVFHVEGV